MDLLVVWQVPAFHVELQLLLGFCKKKLPPSSFSLEALTPGPPSGIFARPDLVCVMHCTPTPAMFFELCWVLVFDVSLVANVLQ